MVQDSLRRRWHFEYLNAERGQSVHDRIDYAGRRANETALAHTFCLGDRCVRQRTAVEDFNRWNLMDRRRQEGRERSGETIADFVVHDLFVERISDALRDTAAYLSIHDHRID